MKITLTNTATGLIRCIGAILCAVSSLVPLPAGLQHIAAAQTGTVPNLTINSCDGSKFPTITCIVTAIDRTGLPAQGLNTAAFEIIDNGGPASGVNVAQNVNSAVTTSILFVVDLNPSLRSAGIQVSKDSIDKALDEMAKDTSRTNDLVALIALGSGKVDVGTNTSSPPINPTYEVPFSIDKVLPRNTLRPLPASAGSTPLYDGVRKALMMTVQQPMGRRAIIVLSDGADSKSSGFTIDSDISMAQRDITPIYTVKIGQNADNAKLQRMAIDTGGEVIQPGTAAEFSAAIKKIQERLKTQYSISFKTSTALGAKPDVLIRWKTTNGTMEQKATTISKIPPAPTVLTGLKINGEVGDLNNTPLKGEVTIEPQFKGPAPVQVQYTLDGQVQVAQQAPWTFTFDADSLAPDTQLIVKITGSGNAVSATTYTLQIEPPPQPTDTPVPTKTPVAGLAVVTSNPTLLIAIAVASVGLLILLILVVVLLSRRKRAQPIYPNTTPDASFTPATSIQQEIPTSIFPQQPAGGSGDAGKTQILDRTSVMAEPAGKTMIWALPKAKLHFDGAVRNGESVNIGIAGQDMEIGREADEMNGNIKLPSIHVSRHHAVLKLDGETMTLTDLGSTSGTRVNGVKIAPQVQTPVKVGDKIEFADVSAVIVEL